MDPEQAQILAELEANPVVGRAKAQNLAKILPTCRRISYRQGRKLIREGEKADKVYCLVSGGVRVFHAGPNDAEIVVKLFGAPVFFGEADVLLGIDWLESVETVMPTVVIEIPGRAFEWLLRRDHALSNAMVADLSARLLVATEQARQLAFGSAESVLASYILDYVNLFGEQQDDGVFVDIRLSQEHIGKSLSMSRKTVHRTLDKWKAAGVLAVKSGRFLVHKPDDLRALTSQKEFGLGYRLEPLQEANGADYPAAGGK